MSALIIDYSELQTIATNATSLASKAENYCNELNSTVYSAFGSVTAGVNDVLSSAMYYVAAKQKSLTEKAEEYARFAGNVCTLIEHAKQADQDVATTWAGVVALATVIGAGIGLANSLTNLATSAMALESRMNGDPAWARIYGKQDKLSDVLRDTNFGNGTLNRLSYGAATTLDTVEFVCDAICIADGIKGSLKTEKTDNIISDNIKKTDDEGLYKRGSFRKSTHANAKKMAPKNANGEMICPTCGEVIPEKITVMTKNGERTRVGYDLDHYPKTWAQRVEEMKKSDYQFTRKEVLDMYNKDVRVQCPKCNQSHLYEGVKGAYAN